MTERREGVRENEMCTRREGRRDGHVEYWDGLYGEVRLVTYYWIAGQTILAK